MRLAQGTNHGVPLSLSTGRRHERCAFRCAVVLAPEGREAILGETIDLSVGGAALSVAEWLPRETPVTLLLSPRAIPVLSDRWLPPLRGVVRSVRLLPGTSTHYRLGIEFVHTTTSFLDVLSPLSAAERELRIR